MSVPKRVCANEFSRHLSKTGLYMVVDQKDYIEITDLHDYTVSKAYVEGGKLSRRIAIMYYNRKKLKFYA